MRAGRLSAVVAGLLLLDPVEAFAAPTAPAASAGQGSTGAGAASPVTNAGTPTASGPGPTVAGPAGTNTTADATGAPAPPGNPTVIGWKTGPLLLIPRAFAQIDYSSSHGPGVSSYQLLDATGLKPGVVINRARPQIMGRLFEHWIFRLQVDFGRSRAASPPTAGGGVGAGADPLSAPPQAPILSMRTNELWAGYELNELLAIRIGQFVVPFMMDNVTPPNNWDLMEPSLTASAHTQNFQDMGLMVLGESDRFNYAVAYANGDGRNRPPIDGVGEVLGRAGVRFGKPGAELSNLAIHVGMSGRYGTRDPKNVQYDASSMATPGGYRFWQPVYLLNTTETHVIPSGGQRAAAAEFVFSFGRFDLLGEAVISHDERREAARGLLDQTLRAGTLDGASYYASLAAWVVGPPRVIGRRGLYGRVPRSLVVDEPAVDTPSVELAVRWEQLFLNYDSIARSSENGQLVAGVNRGFLDLDTPKIRVDSVQIAANLFFSRYLRLTAQFSSFIFPGAQLGEGRRVENQAAAPGAIPPGNALTRPPFIPLGTVVTTPFFQPAAIGARTLHEVSARIQVQF